MYILHFATPKYKIFESATDLVIIFFSKEASYVLSNWLSPVSLHFKALTHVLIFYSLETLQTSSFFLCNFYHPAFMNLLDRFFFNGRL